MKRALHAALLAVLLDCGSAAGAPPVHACELLQRPALEAAVGAPLKAGRKLLAGCIYEAAEGKGQLVVQVRYRGDPLNDYPDRRKALELAGATLAPVSGLGDEAVWGAGPDHLLIRKSGHLLYIDPGLVGGSPARDRAIAIGRVAVAALE